MLTPNKREHNLLKKQIVFLKKKNNHHSSRSYNLRRTELNLTTPSVVDINRNFIQKQHVSLAHRKHFQI